MVLNQGNEVEQGILHEVIANPRNACTPLLLSLIPNPFADLDTPTVLDQG